MPHTAINPGSVCVNKVYSLVTEITDDLEDDEWKHSRFKQEVKLRKRNNGGSNVSLQSGHKYWAWFLCSRC